MDDEIIQVLMLNESARRQISIKQISMARIRTNPEGHKVPCTPLTTFRLDWLQVEVGEHQLGVGETRLALDGELVRIVGKLGVLELLHDGIEAARFAVVLQTICFATS